MSRVKLHNLPLLLSSFYPCGMILNVGVCSKRQQKCKIDANIPQIHPYNPTNIIGFTHESKWERYQQWHTFNRTESK